MAMDAAILAPKRQTQTSKPQLKTVLFWTFVSIDAWIALRIDAGNFIRNFTAAGFQVPGDLRSFLQVGAWVDAHRYLSANGLTKVTLFIFPPPFLLILVPLCRLNAALAYVLWMTLTGCFLVCACRLIKLRWGAISLGLISPPVLLCLVSGQTGMFTSAALLISLGLADSYPIIAGFMAGCLVIKPQCAVLLPICFLASRNWCALAAGAATVSAACLLPLVLIGPGVWKYFFIHEMFAQSQALTAAWPQPYQRLMFSPFMLLRSLGAGLRFSFSAQIIITICCASAVWYLWSRPSENFNALVRLLLTVIFTMLATPYIHLYDLPCLGMALIGWSFMADRVESFAPASFWTVTGLYALLSMFVFLTGSILLLAFAAYFWPKRSEEIAP
jgi:hypothetical protein